MLRLVYALGLACWLVVPVGEASADEALAAFRLPVEEFPLIPGQAGMRFFEGGWQPLARDEYYLTKTFTVTDTTISRDDMNLVSPYRTLIEAENYVLLLVLVHLSSTANGGEDLYSPDFIVLHLRGASPFVEEKGAMADMVYWYCSDPRLTADDAYNRLSKAAILRIFAESDCRKEIDLTDRSKVNALSSREWSGQSFARITAENRGTGWIRNRRNEMLLGVPQGTVPEPKD